MGEIKSTLELALERSKRFSLSEKDREEIKKKEIQEKISTLFFRYQEGYLHLHEIQKEIDRLGEGMAKAVKEGLLLRWVDGLSLEGENEKMLKGIEGLTNRALDEVKEALQKLRLQYQSEKDRLKQEERNRRLEALRRAGLSGDALEPNIETSVEWSKALTALNQKYELQLRELKDRLRVL